MAGHNKWSKIKRQKAATDAKRSKSWARLTRELMVAAREGGSDVSMNAKLALAVDKAKAENMPKDNIQRAIRRGTGEIEGADYEEVAYEGYGPSGIAIYVDCLTDNINRTVSSVRHAFSKHGGNLGTNGSVAYLFDRKGVIDVPAEGIDELELFELVADAGADDLENNDDSFTVTTSVESFAEVQQAITDAGIAINEANLELIPTTTTHLEASEAAKVVRLIDMLEELSDVQAVYTTLEFDDETIEAVS